MHPLCGALPESFLPILHWFYMSLWSLIGILMHCIAADPHSVVGYRSLYLSLSLWKGQWVSS